MTSAYNQITMTPLYEQISECRICKNPNLKLVLDLGVQALTGIFPKSVDATVPSGPLRLVVCHGEETCGLVQLEHNYNLGEMYGDNYGYRSGLNASMVKHLENKVAWLKTRAKLRPWEVVVDIGSNDGTTLGMYPDDTVLIGIDPTIKKFGHYYKSHIAKVPGFFSAETFREKMGDRAKAKIVTSISMLYDLPDPLSFFRDVASILADDGVWHFEQSYLLSMLSTNSFDTVCHEHLEYYSLKQIDWLCRHSGLVITDVSFNDVNGGSFAVTVKKGTDTSHLHDSIVLGESHTNEDSVWKTFRDEVNMARGSLVKILTDLKSSGKKVYGLGASTKGNVLLQYYGITTDLLPKIAEINPDKYGKVTPGSCIPIVSEEEAKADHPDVFLVLPWHFRKSFESREKDFMASGGRLLFPLPVVEYVGRND